MTGTAVMLLTVVCGYIIIRPMEFPYGNLRNMKPLFPDPETEG